MAIVIVPNDLRDALYAKIDEQLVDHPGLIEQRESIYKDLLNYYDEHGVVPDFTLVGVRERGNV